MKTIAIITSLFLGSIATTVAQDTPVPPKPPRTTVSVHSDKTNTSTNYSYTVQDSDSKQKNSNTSISVSSNDNYYSFSAKHSGAKDQEIKELILKEMGTNNLIQTKTKYTWMVAYGDDDVYEIEWRKGRLSMEVDKTIADKQLVDKIAQMGQNAKTIITGKSEKDRSIDRERREVDRKLREADRMRREAERLKRHAERDADRIKREADRLDRDARQAVRDASKRGTISNPVSGLLKKEATFMDTNSPDKDWVLPKVYTALATALVSDGIISQGDDINLTKENTAIYINGEKLEGRQLMNYVRLFIDSGIRPDVQFSYHTQGSHIVIVDDNPRIENFLRTAKKQGLISSVTKKLKLEINGNSVLRNGEELSQADLKRFNKLLLDNRIIASPGKIIEIMSKDSFKLGYSLGKKAHIGTWVMGGR